MQNYWDKCICLFCNNKPYVHKQDDDLIYIRHHAGQVASCICYEMIIDIKNFGISIELLRGKFSVNGNIVFLTNSKTFEESYHDYEYTNCRIIITNSIEECLEKVNNINLLG